MKMIPVTSSNVKEVGYIESTETLLVRFNGGTLYRYTEVSKHVFDELLIAASIGSFISQKIKGNYNFYPITDEHEFFSKVDDLFKEFDTTSVVKDKLNGVELIAKERQRQINVEGFTVEHDLIHTDGELAQAASVYADIANYNGEFSLIEDTTKKVKVLIDRTFKWPFDMKLWKPTPDDRIRELSKAGALIAAEIDRLLYLKENIS